MQPGKRRIKKGQTLPPELGARLVRLLASGCVDVPSGRFVTTEDDIVRLVSQAEVIERDELYTLRLREQSQ